MLVVTVLSAPAVVLLGAESSSTESACCCRKENDAVCRLAGGLGTAAMSDGAPEATRSSDPTLLTLCSENRILPADVVWS
mgnify:CR=1 FL=1